MISLQKFPPEVYLIKGLAFGDGFREGVRIGFKTYGKAQKKAGRKLPAVEIQMISV
jgi:hypothetical protein